MTALATASDHDQRGLGGSILECPVYVDPRRSIGRSESPPWVDLRRSPRRRERPRSAECIGWGSPQKAFVPDQPRAVAAANVIAFGRSAPQFIPSAAKERSR